MENEGLVGVELEGFQWYDSGATTLAQGKSITHLRREDMSDEIRIGMKDTTSALTVKMIEQKDLIIRCTNGDGRPSHSSDVQSAP